MASAVAGQAFKGFPKGGFDFFFELQMRQDRDWFKANKDRYQRFWVDPFEALLADLSDRLADVFPDMPSARRHVFRIQRDTRFSADKSPYKNHVAAHIQIRPSAGSEWGVPGVYLHFGLENNFLGAGSWEVSKEQLPRLREAVANERTGSALQAIIEDLQAHAIRPSSHEALKRVPAPYPQDHPRADLLKLKGLSVGTEEIPEELMAEPAFLDWASERFHRMAAAVLWLEEVLR